MLRLITAMTPERRGSFRIASIVSRDVLVTASTSRSDSAAIRSDNAAPMTGKASASTTPIDGGGRASACSGLVMGCMGRRQTMKPLPDTAAIRQLRYLSLYRRPGPSVPVDQSEPGSPVQRLDPGSHLELAVDLPDVRLGRSLGHAQPARDLSGGKTLRDQRQDLALPRRERGENPGRVSGFSGELPQMLVGPALLFQAEHPGPFGDGSDGSSDLFDGRTLVDV